MKLTNDESRALAFIAGLLLLSSAVRMAAAREPAEIPAGAVDLAAHAAATGAAVAEAERAARPLEPGERIDPNTADAIELDRLPRVGPSLASRIIQDREANGPFATADDLGRVPGIGPKMLEDLGPLLLVTGGPRVLRTGGLRGGTQSGARGGHPAAEAIDLNRADAAMLQTLPGIGPALAARIVAYRDSAGPFAHPDSLVAVRGIGPATLAGLRDRLRTGYR